MENLILNFYNYENVIAAYEYIDQILGAWIYVLVVPLYKIRVTYIYTWWKLILLHILHFISFVLAFNDAAHISDFANISYTPLSSNTLTLIVTAYFYTLISIVLMYINAITFERYELVYNLKAIWNIIYKLFQWAFKFGGLLFEIFSGQVNTGSISQSYTNIQTSKKPQVSHKTVIQQVKVLPKTPKTKKTKKSKIPTKKQSNKKTNKVYTDTGHHYPLLNQIAAGGEGKIYAISHNLLAKIFHESMATQEKEEKLLKLLSMTKMSSVVFPQKLLYDTDKKFVGYTMNQIYGTKELAILHIPVNRKKYYPHWTYIDLLDLSITISKTLKRLHDKGILVADFNPRNVLVKESKKIYFIDIDSYQVDRQVSTVGIKMYTRPMHFDKSHKEYLKNQSDDIYALTVIIFQNLMSGANPYAMKGESDEDELIENHKFSFNTNEPYKSNVSDKLLDAWVNLSDSLRSQFEEVFKFQRPISLSKLTKALEDHKITLIRGQTKTRRQTA